MKHFLFKVECVIDSWSTAVSPSGLNGIWFLQPLQKWYVMEWGDGENLYQIYALCSSTIGSCFAINDQDLSIYIKCIFNHPILSRPVLFIDWMTGDRKDDSVELIVNRRYMISGDSRSFHQINFVSKWYISSNGFLIRTASTSFPL